LATKTQRRRSSRHALRAGPPTGSADLWCRAQELLDRIVPFFVEAATLRATKVRGMAHFRCARAERGGAQLDEEAVKAAGKKSNKARNAALDPTTEA
jgi:hypothetical protein